MGVRQVARWAQLRLHATSRLLCGISPPRLSGRVPSADRVVSQWARCRGSTKLVEGGTNSQARMPWSSTRGSSDAQDQAVLRVTQSTRTPAWH